MSEPLTHKHVLAWLAGATVAVVAASLTFGSSVVSRAETTATNIARQAADRCEARTVHLERRVDELMRIRDAR